jgi:hypothetical protein
MKELTTFYEKKVAQLEKEHTAWVTSNKKMRSIEQALSQIKSVGDIDITPAEVVLRTEYAREKTKNEKLCTHMYDLKEFVCSIETEAKEYGENWSKSIEIFRY